jgi:hypothetical protein
VQITALSNHKPGSWTQNVEHRDYQSTELVVDGKTLAWAYADTAGDSAEDDYGSSSQTVVVKVINTRCVRTMYVLVTIINPIYQKQVQ